MFLTLQNRRGAMTTFQFSELLYQIPILNLCVTCYFTMGKYIPFPIVK